VNERNDLEVNDLEEKPHFIGKSMYYDIPETEMPRLSKLAEGLGTLGCRAASALEAPFKFAGGVFQGCFELFGLKKPK